MNIPETAVRAAKGIDTADWLDHIAWTDCIEPKLLATRDALTKELVQATLNPGPQAKPAELAGKIAGIDFVRAEIVRLVRDGRSASDDLRQRGISLKD